jgi:hypothetical protein
MSQPFLNLYQVLVAEYNSQGILPPILDSDTEEMRARVILRFAAIQDETERQKRVDKAMVAEFYDWLRVHKVKRAALCLSGGGIRSGTFALGLIQGLARHNLLKRFDYLSTVSGGGYIGSWLTAWIHRHPNGLSGVTSELANINPAHKIDPDPGPLRYLRERRYVDLHRNLLEESFPELVGVYSVADFRTDDPAPGRDDDPGTTGERISSVLARPRNWNDSIWPAHLPGTWFCSWRLGAGLHYFQSSRRPGTIAGTQQFLA